MLPFPLQSGILRTCTAAACWLAALVFLVGFGASPSHAKCGGAVRGAAWKYGSTADLITWDGRWWSTESESGGMRDDSHADPDAKPCTHCGGRPKGDAPAPAEMPVVRVDSQTPVFADQAGLKDGSTSPERDLILEDLSMTGRTLEVAKRPPKGRI